MAYIVTHTNPHPGPAEIDIRPSGFDLDGALAHACQLLSEGLLDVAIQDGAGNSIRGDDLLACCRGEKKLTAELRALSN
jgi:hypothetical protein